MRPSTFRQVLPAVALLALALGVRGATPAQPAPVAELRLEPADGEYLAWADNRLAGPVEVLLSCGRGCNLQSDPGLPARASVPAGGSVLVARLQLPSGRSGSLGLSLKGVPGHPSTRPRDVEYAPPLAGAAGRIEQGFGGEFSHDDDENRYALDFAAAIGTPVLAARAGLVMQVESSFARAGLERTRDGGRANFVRVLHDDGTMALYAHLATNGVLVRIGQQVETGQRIGLSGNTGYTTGPHLHFSVQVNRGLKLVSIPFRMRGMPPPPQSRDGQGGSPAE